MDGRAGPFPVPSPWGKPWGFDAAEGQRIEGLTGVHIGFRRRAQWGPGWFITATGPLARIEDAVAMAQAV